MGIKTTEKQLIHEVINVIHKINRDFIELKFCEMFIKIIKFWYNLELFIDFFIVEKMFKLSENDNILQKIKNLPKVKYFDILQ